MSIKTGRTIRKFLPEELNELWRGKIVEVDGSATVPNNPLFSWVRPETGGQPLPIYNDSTPHVKGRRVVIGNDKVDKRVRVLHGKWTAGTTQTINPNIGAHDHGPNSTNPVYIADWQILPLLIYATTGMTVHCNGGEIKYQSQVVNVSAEDIDLTSSIPGSGASYSLIRLSGAGVWSVQDGTPVDSILDLTDDDIPVCAAGYAAIAYARLYAGQTALSKLISNPDIRMLIWGSGIFDIEDFSGFDDSEGDPVDVDATAAADGTSVYASRRDHGHHLGDHEHIEADITDLEHDAVKLQGRTLSSAAPSVNDGIKWDGSQWEPGDFNSGGGGEIFWEIDGALAAIPDVGLAYVVPYDCTIVSVIIFVEDQGSAGSTVLDVNVNDVSIFPVSTKPTVAYDDANGYDERVPDTVSLLKNDIIRVDTDSVGTDSEGLRIIINRTVSTGQGSGAICQGRLTLVTDTPVTTADVTAATTLYFTPDGGNLVGVFDGTAWVIHSFSEISLDISALVADTNYDIFIYDDAGTLTLEETAWTNATTRATALAAQNGVYVKSGAATRRYLGTIRITDQTGECEESLLKRYVWNYANRILRTMRVAEATGHNYATATYRSWNADDAVRVQFVIGLVEERINLRLWGDLTPGVDARRALVSIGYDVNNNYLGTYNSIIEAGCAQRMRIATSVSHLPDIGFHYYQVTEIAASGTSVAFNNVEMEADVYG